jgi:hypothetical protein
MKVKSILTTLLVLTAAFCFAQTDSTTTGGGSFSLPSKITFWITILLSAYELVIRYFPTVSSYSIVTLAIRIFKFLVPDRSTKGKDHE